MLSVQSAVMAALRGILGKGFSESLVGCGRTDAGVHALGLVAHFDTSIVLPRTFLRSLNAVLPPDIKVSALWQVPAQAHARYDALWRAYCYEIHTIPHALRWKHSAFFPYALDIDKMNALAAAFVSMRCFRGLARQWPADAEGRCQVMYARWHKVEAFSPMQQGYRFEIRANRFLRGMVRAAVGISVEVGRGKCALEEAQSLLRQPVRAAQIPTAPPEGLYFTEVGYDKTIMAALEAQTAENGVALSQISSSQAEKRVFKEV